MARRRRASAHQILIDAKALVESGWCQRAWEITDLQTRRRRYCALGALITSALDGGRRRSLDGSNFVDAAKTLVAAIGVPWPGESGTSAIVTFNDQAGQTQDCVIAAFAKAEEIAVANG